MSESEFVIKLNEEVSVSGQLTAEMVEQVKALGFASVICNRPDGEGPDQPTAAEIEAACSALGMTFAYVPFNPMNPSPTLQADFTEAYKAAPKPLLAYCRSGQRSARLISQVDA